MELKSFVARVAGGEIVPGATYYVYLADTITLATIYDKDGIAIANPGAASASGQITFAAADGDYDLRVTDGVALDNQIRVRFKDLRDYFVRPEDFGGIGNGTIDDTAAFQAALNTGRPVYLGGPEKVWRLDSEVTYSGKVIIFGDGATVKTDKNIAVYDGTGSRVYGFKFLPITTPYTLRRNTTTWVNSVSDVVQSLEGYQPTALDEDIWGSLPQVVRDQAINKSVNPGLLFTSTTTFGISDVQVYRITGRAVSIKLEGASDSSVNFCTDLGGGPRNCIEFFNGATIGGTIQLPRGRGNQALGNRVKYAAQNGIVYWGQDGFEASNNVSTYNGESGIKCYQRDGVWSAAISSNGDKVVGNTTAFNYYDGIDAQRYYGVPDAGDLCLSNIVGNTSHNNRHTGITVNGIGGTTASNTCFANGSHGVSVKGKNCTVTGNNARNNAAHPEIHAFQLFDIIVQGDGIASFGNSVENPSAPYTYNYIHTGTIGVDPSAGNPGMDFGNNCSAGQSRSFVSKNIPSSYNIRSAGAIVVPLKLVGTSTYTVADDDHTLDFFTIETCTVTLPAPSSCPGRVLKMRNTNTFAINSASANVSPLAGGAPSAAILPNVSGKWCELHSDGSTWKIMAAN